MLGKKHLKCPDCGELRHFSLRVGMLIYVERNGRKVYEWHCPTCNTYGSVEKKR